jgi:Leucine-rich repeat (LRR) protein
MLAHLHASHCNLSYLPPLSGLQCLVTADFSYNRITAVPRTIGGLSTLTDLNLAGNLLVALPSEMAALAPTLRALALHGNPLAPELLLRSHQPALLFSHLQSLSETALAELEALHSEREQRSQRGAGNSATHSSGCLEELDTSGVLDWPVERVCEWLVRLGLAVYREPFRSAEVTGAVLVQLTDEQLGAHLHVYSRHLELLRRQIDRLRAPLSLTRVSASRTSPQRGSAPLSPKRTTSNGAASFALSPNASSFGSSNTGGSSGGVPLSFIVSSELPVTRSPDRRGSPRNTP